MKEIRANRIYTKKEIRDFINDMRKDIYIDTLGRQQYPKVKAYFNDSMYKIYDGGSFYFNALDMLKGSQRDPIFLDGIKDNKFVDFKYEEWTKEEFEYLIFSDYSVRAKYFKVSNNHFLIYNEDFEEDTYLNIKDYNIPNSYIAYLTAKKYMKDIDEVKEEVYKKMVENHDPSDVYATEIQKYLGCSLETAQDLRYELLERLNKQS